MEKPNISKEEQIGFHKGALTTLANERNELIKIISTVEKIMQMHIAALGELGVKIDAESSNEPQKQSTKKKMEDLL